MPVSSPSYFPPSRTNGSIIGITAGFQATGARNFLAMQSAGDHSAVADIIVIGNRALDSSVTDADAAGMVVIGNSACTNLTDVRTGPNVAIGFEALTLNTTGGANVVIGHQAAASYVGTVAFTLTNTVAIGYQAYGNINHTANGEGDVVAIGFQAAKGSAPGTNTSNLRSVFIGSGVAAGCTGSNTNNVIVGALTAASITGAGNNVIVGANACSTFTSGDENVILGASTTAAAAATGNVLVGYSNAVGSGATNNTLVGHAISQFSGVSSGNIALGKSAGTGEAVGATHLLVIETVITGTRRAALYGNLATGNLVAGNSIPGTNRDFDGVNSRNILKLLNGTVGGLAPIGGGYFYVVAGALHWVGSAGTDTVVAPA